MRRVDPKHYTKKYYLSDASGFKEYKKSFGKVLESRFSRIIKEIPLKNGMNVLDIGCGRGELVLWVARSGAAKVIGIDYSKDAIALANKAKKHSIEHIKSKVNFRVEDAKKMKFKNNSFDLIILTEVLEHLYPEEQIYILKKVYKILKNDGFVFIHTAPSKWFNDYTYKFWCYPISSVLVSVNNFINRGKYPNISKPEYIRTSSHNIMHVNEPKYFSLKKTFDMVGFHGNVLSTNVTVAKPTISWKDAVFNLLVYLIPFSNHRPLNILWGSDFYSILTKI